MSRGWVYAAFFALFLLGTGRWAYGQANVGSPSQETALPNESPNQAPPGLAPTPAIPANQALAAPGAASIGAPGVLPDTANSTKFYTITASLREEYDDNIYTTKDNRVSSPVTEISPSFLVNFPLQDSTFSGRYTFGFDYYENRSGDPNDYTNEVLLHYTHQFTNRFSLDLRDQGGYYTQPNLLNAVGSPFESGDYFSNTATAEFDAQWTPLFGTVTTYSNVAVLYSNSTVGQNQNFDENTFSNDFRYAIYPKYTFVVGAILDDIDYFSANRGYTNYTGNFGVDWQILPSVVLSGRIGGTLTTAVDLGDSVSPYASASVSWRLGKRSSVNFNYVHNVEPTDVFNAVGQEADRFSLRADYDITARTTAHVAGTFTHSDYTSDLLETGPSFTEDDLGLDIGLVYHVNANFSFEGGYFLSDISSQENYRDYTRNQVYLGVRGTY